jgi:hypothetical protein
MPKKMSRLLVISFGLVIPLLTILFAPVTSSLGLFAWRVFNSASHNGSYVTAYSIPGWNVTEIGITGTFADAGTWANSRG